MRHPQALKSAATGETYYRVRYRRAGQQKALTFWGPSAKADADEFTGLLATLGADRAVTWWNAQLDQLDDSPTLDDWFGRYLRSLTGITDGTRVSYERIYARVWSPALGQRPLTMIAREDVAQVVNQLSATKSDKTVRNAFGVLTSCLKVAVADGLIPANPSTGIRLPRRTEHTATEMRFLTHDEWRRLYTELPRHYRPLFSTLVGTGMRWGEAEALLVGDVVLDGMVLDDGRIVPVVRIGKAAKWNASRATRDVGPTKTRRSNRTVALPLEVVEELAPLLDRSPAERLFLAPRGGQLRHRTVYDDWKAAVARAGLVPQPRIHDLRHTHVAWLIAHGQSLPVIQARLGHENITTTIDRYGHLLPDLQAAAADAASLAMQARPAVSHPVPPAELT